MRRLLALVLLLCSSRAFAQTTFSYCGDDISRLCPQRSSTDIASCLMSQRPDLSPQCRGEIERYVQLKEQASSIGGGALSSFGGLNALGAPLPLVSYEGRYGPGPTTNSTFENRGNISSPVYKDANDVYALSLAVSQLHFSDTLKLDSGERVSSEYDRAELGAQFFRQLESRKFWNARGSVGYAGDQTYLVGSDMTYSVNANYGFPGANGFWIASVFFSNNSPFGNYIPIPGIAYLYKRETFTALIGFPILSLQWTPTRVWSVSFSAFGPILQLETAASITDRSQLFAGVYWIRQNYIPRDRSSDQDRITFEEKKMAAGARVLLSRWLLGELQFGQAFDRNVYLSSGYLSGKKGNASLGNDVFASWSLKAKF